ncbi:MAG: hypothetical protein IJB96_05600 [Lachnospira sp.]|nr:hypothetical protein [Lachnospira sp.]
MFFNKFNFMFKRIASVVSATVLLLSAPALVYADETVAPADRNTTFSFADIDLAVDVSDDLVCFTRNVSSNNAYLEKIGAENAEGLRNTMIANHVYLEAIPKDSEHVTYEIIIAGDKLKDTEVTDLSTLSDTELNNLLKDYTGNINKETEQVKETLVNSSIKKIGDATYFCTDIESVSVATDITVNVKKYYTIKNGYYYTFSVQTTEKSITSDMNNNINSILNSARYKEIKAGLFDNPMFSEITSMLLTCVAPIAILAFIFWISVSMTTKRKKKV